MRSRYWRFTLYPDAGEAGGFFVGVGGGGGRRRGRAESGEGAGGGGAAGGGEGASLLRGEPAQPARDADLPGRGLPRPDALRP